MSKNCSTDEPAFVRLPNHDNRVCRVREVYTESEMAFVVVEWDEGRLGTISLRYTQPATEEEYILWTLSH